MFTRLLQPGKWDFAPNQSRELEKDHQSIAGSEHAKIFIRQRLAIFSAFVPCTGQERLVGLSTGSSMPTSACKCNCQRRNAGAAGAGSWLELPLAGACCHHSTG